MGAVMFAFGFLNKYNIVFQLFGLIPAILITHQRKIFLQPKLYVAAALGLAIIAPNLLWQYTNDFPIFHHLKQLSETQLVNVDRVVFLQSQVLFFIGSVLVIFSSLYALLLYKPFEQYRFYFWSMLFTLGLFIFFKAKDYYAIGIYPIYIAFGAVYLGEILKNGWKRYLQPVLIAVPLLLFIPIYNVGFPNKSPEYISQNSEKYKRFGLLRWEDGKDHLLPQDFADMLGWKELAYKVDSVYSTLPDNGNTLILCDNYGQAGAINYYTNKKLQAVSFNADYINWFDLSKHYDHLIRVKEKEGTKSELEETSPFFEHSMLAASVTNRYAREFGTSVFAFTGAKIDIRKRIKNEIEEKTDYRLR
jgi:hypothetical protein